jgi:hypothetical protein
MFAALTFHFVDAVTSVLEQSLLVQSVLPNGVIETVFTGGAFAAPYAAGSTHASITGGFSFSVARAGGWAYPEAILLVAGADEGRNQALSLYQVNILNPSPPDIVAPVVGNYSPPPLTEIAATDPLFFDVTDDSGLFRRILVVVAYPDNTAEFVHDDVSFLAPFDAFSTRVPIANGWHYRLRRRGGWPKSPTIRAFVYDRNGNEAT